VRFKCLHSPHDHGQQQGRERDQAFVLGRKAWLFSDTQAGANASALIYSLVETAKANRIESYLWLKRALDGLPTARTADDFEALLPWNFHLTE
jgi:transposase